MWIPISLTVKRLGSHINTTFPFVQGQVRLITGENGSGKSIITEGISIALLGVIIRKDTNISDLINENHDDAEVNFTMKNILTHMEMVINRKFSRTKSQILTLTIDTEEKKLGGVTPTEDYIFSLIGIVKSDVLNYFIVHKDKYLPFFGSSDTIKKQVISRFSGATLVNGVFPKIDIDINEVTTKIGTISADINRSEGMILAYQKQIEELVNYDPKKEREDNIKALEELNTGRQKTIDWRVEESTNLTNQHLVNSKKIILWDSRLKILIYPYSENEKELVIIAENAFKVKIELDKTNKELTQEKAELEKFLAGEIECPKCHAKFILDNEELSVEKMKEGLEEVEKQLIENNTALEELDTDANQIKAQEQIYEKKFKQYERIKNTCTEIIELQKKRNKGILLEIEDNSKHIQTVEKNIKETQDEIKKTKEQNIVNKKDELNQKINNIKLDIKAFETDKLTKVKDLELYNEWIEYYKSFISFLANKAIKNIEGYTNLHLNKFRSDLQVIIEGHKELKKLDEIRDEIATHVVRNGRKAPFGRHSNGQRVRISLANIFALQNLINSTAPSGGLGYCILDEIMESLDVRGIKGVINALDNLDLTIDLVTPVSSEITGVPIITMELINEETKMTIK